jgi:hypothetical protein
MLIGICFEQKRKYKTSSTIIRTVWSNIKKLIFKLSINNRPFAVINSSTIKKTGGAMSNRNLGGIDWV